jgi:hypothetical protein
VSIRRWLAERFPNSPLNHATSVVPDAEAVQFERLDGLSGSLAWEQVTRVTIRTTDQGPFVEDVFYILESADGETLVVPQMAPGCEELLSALQALPGFDNEAVIAAMACTDNQEFLCWERPSAGG